MVIVWSEMQMCIRLSWCHCHSLSLGFTFLVLAHPGSPGQRAIKRVCVCVCGCCNVVDECVACVSASQCTHILLPLMKFIAEVDISDVPTFYLTDNCYLLYPFTHWIVTCSLIVYVTSFQYRVTICNLRPCLPLTKFDTEVVKTETLSENWQSWQPVIEQPDSSD